VRIRDFFSTNSALINVQHLGMKVDTHFEKKKNYVRQKYFGTGFSARSHPKASYTDGFANAYTSNTHCTL